MHEAFGLRATLMFDLAPGEYHTNVVLAVLAGRAALVCPRRLRRPGGGRGHRARSMRRTRSACRRPSMPPSPATAIALSADVGLDERGAGARADREPPRRAGARPDSRVRSVAAGRDRSRRRIAALLRGGDFLSGDGPERPECRTCGRKLRTDSPLRSENAAPSRHCSSARSFPFMSIRKSVASVDRRLSCCALADGRLRGRGPARGRRPRGADRDDAGARTPAARHDAGPRPRPARSERCVGRLGAPGRARDRAARCSAPSACSTTAATSTGSR